MKKALLDTNIVSAFIRGQEVVLSYARNYLQFHERFTLSTITYYEIMRGIKDISSRKKDNIFRDFISECELIDFDRCIADKAAEIYSSLRRKGMLVEDADILIAATALEHDLNMVTGNTRHFMRIEGLILENWLE